MENKINELVNEETIKALVVEIIKKSKDATNENFRYDTSSFTTINYPTNERVIPNITFKDLEDLKYDDSITSIERIVNIFIDKRNLFYVTGISNIGKEKIDFQIPLSLKQNKIFFRKYQGKSIMCKATITYNEDFDQYSLFYLGVYEISSPLEQWQELLKGKTLLERINILLPILGLNPDVLLYHEKMIFIERLIPLVVKKILLVDISKKELGKTHSYSLLGFNPYTLLVTRANAFVDGRNGKGGDFFSESIAFIIDEISKINDPELITAFQIYMNGDKYKGKIQVNGNDRRETDISPIILGNTKVKINLLNLFIEQQNPTTIFDNTIIMDSADGEAFVSRITALLNSWGCRTFSSLMKSNIEENPYNLELLKAVIPILREKEFKVNSLLEMLGIFWKSPSIRSSESVEKNFEGFIKLLYPEFIDGIGRNEVTKHYDEFYFLYERAIEMRKVVDNQLKIININDNTEITFPPLHSASKSVMFNITDPHIFTPHRILVYKPNGFIEKIPLDTVGIGINKIEMEDLNNYEEDLNNYEYSIDENYFLTHSYGLKISHPIDLAFNYLTGETEEITSNRDSNFLLDHFFS